MPGNNILVLNAPDGYLPMLQALPDGAEIKTATGGIFDVVQLFVQNKAELPSRAMGTIKALKSGGSLWVSLPKKTSKKQSDLSRDVGWDSVRAAGFEGVSLVSIGDTWSAMRCRPLSEVKSRKRE